MKQRIVIAIACGSRVMSGDEPTPALDVTTQAQIMDLLDDLRTTRGISTVVITHNLVRAASRAQRVLVMYADQVVEALPAADADGGLPRPIDGRPPDPLSRRPGHLRQGRAG